MKYSYNFVLVALHLPYWNLKQENAAKMKEKQMRFVQTGLLHTHKHFISLFTTVLLQQCMWYLYCKLWRLYASR